MIWRRIEAALTLDGLQIIASLIFITIIVGIIFTMNPKDEVRRQQERQAQLQADEDRLVAEKLSQGYENRTGFLGFNYFVKVRPSDKYLESHK